MGKYFNQLNPEVKQYFKILSNEFPEWLEEYIDTDEMQRINKISMSCGMDYSKCFNMRYWYSNLDHSVGVALIIWNFTHDKKQTLAGLFHDIATPVFKHCIDFMNGDSEKQESTEERTLEILEKSIKINKLLKRDNIKLSEVSDYKIYPIADNDMPKLSADRFEYTFSSGLTLYRIWELDKIKEMYSNVTIVKNEDGIEELCFKDAKVCEEYIHIISKLWPVWVADNNRTVMQFIADMCKSLNNMGELTVDDLYSLGEEEVIKKFKCNNSEYIRNAWNNFVQCDTTYKNEEMIENKYCVNVRSKTRYLNPMVLVGENVDRINNVSVSAKNDIENFLNSQKGGYYTYFDFDFKPL